MNALWKIGLVLLLAPMFVTLAEAQRPGRGFRHGHGHGHDERHDEDRNDFHFLLSHHEKISRNVTQLTDGVATLTESEIPEIADRIKKHVKWMKYRVEETKPIRMRDPLFVELFRNTDKIKMKVVETKKGVRVTETSDDPYVAKLIKAHAKAVSGFVKVGFAEARKNHAVPSKDEATQAQKKK